MKFFARFFLAVFFCIHLQYPAYAQDLFCANQQQKKILVVFGNGVLSNMDNADKSVAEIKTRLRAVLLPDQFTLLEFKIAYNTSVSGLADVYEAVEQKIANDSYVTQFWRWMSNLDPLPDWLQETMKERLAAIDPVSYLDAHDISNHLQIYRTAILEGKIVVEVAHSQGNFGANKASEILYNDLNPIPTRSFGIVGVANPASFVSGGGPYSTLAEDAVINAIRLVSVIGAAQPLPANVTNFPLPIVDPLRHLFVESYLYPSSPSETKILNDIVSMVQELVQPPQLAQPGAITVTLWWNDQPDVDLHAFEDLGVIGAHVYYNNMVGIAGRLDVDDVYQFGPEHYTISCDMLQAGTYRIGVNYYYGASPETAQVQIVAGTSVRSFTRVLPTALGSSGNDTPVPVADIVVTGDQTNGFSFDIREVVPSQTPTITFGQF
ncbi:MAG: hypothetical protein HZB09_01210 [Candidatus Yonathbacteria bacterium]|nr:hypothetical protein [Candidatus Yonathbacteria bacterium]